MRPKSILLSILLGLIATACGDKEEPDAHRTISNGDYTFEVHRTPMYAILTECNSPISTANIPSTITDEGHTFHVTAIANGAFSRMASLTTVVLPSSVTALGVMPDGYFVNWSDGVFEGCSNLSSVTIPNTVTELGENIFSGCSSLKTITLPPYISRIPDGMFRNSGLEEITIPSSIEEIGSYAFSECSSLRHIKMEAETPPSVWTSTFSDVSGCILEVPKGAVEAYSGYPWNELGLITDGETTVGLPEITGFTVGALTYTIYLSPNGNTATLTDGKNASGAVNIPLNISFDNFKFPVTAIENAAFAYNDNLTSINIPNSVTCIGKSAFYECSNLVSINIPNSVTSIKDFSFTYCSSLASINIPNSVTNIGELAFHYCSSLTSINIPNSVTSIEQYAFAFCSSLTGITIPSSITTINDYTFYNCEKLSNVVLPSSINSIGYYAFEYAGLTRVDCHAITPPTVDYGAFDDTPSYTLHVPSGSKEAYEAVKAQWGAGEIIADL